tara:strand:- start:66 stop:1352 length:1287 start_codon:yes stop_codon:yes gene_type:complete
MLINREQIERTLIGKIINNPQDYYNNHSLLSAGLFSNSYNKRVYELISKTLDKGHKVDLVTLSENIDDIEKVAKMMSDDAIFETQTQTCVLVLNQHQKREQLKGFTLKVNKMISDDDDIFEIMEYVDEEIGKISSIDNEGVVEIKDQIGELLKSIEHKMNNEGLNGITTGFNNIDKFTGGWQETDLVIVGGASSMGKTSLALAFAFNASFYGKVPTVLFSYEMSNQQLLSRLISSDSGIDNKWILKGSLDQSELGRIHESAGRIEKTPIYIDDCNNSSLRYLVNKIRQYVITKKVKLVMVDYLQLVSNNKKGRSREQEVSEVARALKNVAKELKITIIALSQLNRGVGQRAESRPTIADLRESGEIEQAADMVVLIYRPEYYGINKDERGNSTDGLAEVIFAKGRNIGTGVLGLRFQKELTKFHEIQK